MTKNEQIFINQKSCETHVGLYPAPMNQGLVSRKTIRYSRIAIREIDGLLWRLKIHQ